MSFICPRSSLPGQLKPEKVQHDTSNQLRTSVMSLTLPDVTIGREHKMRGTSRLTDREKKLKIREKGMAR